MCSQHPQRKGTCPHNTHTQKEGTKSTVSKEGKQLCSLYTQRRGLHSGHPQIVDGTVPADRPHLRRDREVNNFPSTTGVLTHSY